MLDGPIRILTVGTCDRVRQSLRRFIDDDRWGRRNKPVLSEALTGAEGYRRCRLEVPHCILVDYHLPDLDGLQLIRRITKRKLPDAGFPVVVMLADSHEEAQAAVTMRHVVHEVVVRDEMTRETIDEAMRRVFATVRLRQRSAAKSRKLSQAQDQLHAAGEIQHRVLPASAPCVPGFDVAGTCQPADAAGGDFFDYFPFGDDSWGIAIGDVCGHGLGPALLAIDCRAYLRAISRARLSPGEVLLHCNDLLCQDTRGESFVTVCLVQLAAHSPLVCFAAAGHQSFILRHCGTTRPLDSQQPPLGIHSDLCFGLQDQLLMDPGDLLLLVTDGVLEATAGRTRTASFTTTFGVQRALQAVQKSRHRSAASIVETLLRSVRQFTNCRSQDDDMTAVVVKAEAEGLTRLPLPQSLHLR